MHNYNLFYMYPEKTQISRLPREFFSEYFNKGEINLQRKDLHRMTWSSETPPNPAKCEQVKGEGPPNVVRKRGMFLSDAGSKRE